MRRSSRNDRARARRLVYIGAACSAMSGIAACNSDAGGSADRLVELTQVRLYDADDSLNGVRSLSVEANGDAWILGATEPYVHRYDSAGRLISSFGKAGEGPGELRASHEILAPTVADSHVVVWSAGIGRLSRFTRDGTPAGTAGPVTINRVVPTVVERYSFARAIPMARWGSGFLLQDQRRRETPGLANVMQLASSGLVVLDSAGTTKDTLVEFAKLIGPTRPGSMVVDLAPIPLWTVCGDGSAAVLDPYAMRVRWYGADGRRTGFDTLSLAEQAITDQDIERWLRNSATISEVTGGRVVPAAVMDERLEEYLGARRAELGTVAPPGVRLLCDEDRQLWLQRYRTADEPRGLGRDWVVLNRGRVVRQYRFPARFQPMAIHAGSAIGVQKDSLDLERIASVKITR